VCCASASTLPGAGLPVDTLSMGMSADLDAAIAEGATEVRVGTGDFREGATDDRDIHWRRQHGDALIGGSIATGIRRPGFASSSQYPRNVTHWRREFAGIGVFPRLRGGRSKRRMRSCWQ